jgi:glycerol uptake facilitator-like aquaporin
VRGPGLLLMKSRQADGVSPSRVVRLSLARRAAAEAIGTALLVAAVIGSGISASRLSPSETGLQLFENAMATGAALVAIILAFAPVSGAYLNPIVTAVNAARGRLAPR